MSKAELPHFRYYRDPVKAGSVTASDETCIVCGTARGYVVGQAVYDPEDWGCELCTECVCPWCVADGSAHQRYEMVFTPLEMIGEYPYGPGFLPKPNPGIPLSVLEEVAYRTPSVATWQGSLWLTHCNDAAEFIDHVGHEELTAYGSEAVNALRAGFGTLEDSAWQEIFSKFDRDGLLVAHLFQCLHCGKYLVIPDWG